MAEGVHGHVSSSQERDKLQHDPNVVEDLLVEKREDEVHLFFCYELSAVYVLYSPSTGNHLAAALHVPVPAYERGGLKS
eukprot:2190468-Amphidinium_carterae.1